MARPRNYETHTVLVAAKEAFWSGGYQPTGIEDLERATGLGRSSLYLAFGTKHALFDAALAEYEESFLTPLLAAVEGPGAGLREAAGLFTTLSAMFRDPGSRRGCLAVNSIAELAGRDPAFTPKAARLAGRYRLAFSNALRGAARQGDMDRRLVAGRANLLAASVLGAWVAVRADPAAAVADCRAIAREIASWSASRPSRREPGTAAAGRGRRPGGVG